MNNIESFGSINHYRELILRIKDNKFLWRKVARILNKLRLDLRPWVVVDRATQLEVAKKYVIQALNDSVLPEDVKIFMKRGMESEFGFTFE